MQRSHDRAGSINVMQAARTRAAMRWLAALFQVFVLAVAIVSTAFAPAFAAPPSEGERCVRHDKGRIECRSPATKGTDAFVYSWVVTPDMAGQTLDVSSLTLGVSVFPPVQAIAAGQTQVTFEIKGAAPGQTVKLAKKLLEAEQDKGGSAESCCIEEYEIKIPQAKLCVQSVALRTPRPGLEMAIVPPAKVLIEKSCAACAAGGSCRCKITVRNVGTEPLTAPVKFRDDTRLTGGDDDGDVARIGSIEPDGTDWNCSGPPKSLRCELPAQSLKPVSSRSVVVTLEPREPKAGQGQRMRNCVSLQGDNPGYTIVGDREQCADLGGDITVRKTGDQNCRFGEQCTFDVTIANRSKGAYIGPLMLADDMSLGKSSGRKAEIVSIEPPLGCANEPRSLPFACSANVVLPGGKSRTHRIVVRMPRETDGGKDGKDELSGRNCFAAGAPSSDRNAPGENVASLLKAAKASAKTSSSSAQARACVEFTALPRCPGDLVLQGSQCACPGGTERVDDDRCRPACGPGERLRGGECVPYERPTVTPLPIAPPRERPPPPRETVFSCPGELQSYGRPGNQYCDCPPGEVRSGDQCSPPRIGPCPGDLKRYGSPPNEYCACREGLVRRGVQCRPAPTPVPIICTGGLTLYGPPGNQYCGCPPGQIQKGSTCTCPGGLRPYGQTCGCPPGQIQRGISCAFPLPPPCLGDLKLYGPPGRQVCGCPPGQIQSGNACNCPPNTLKNRDVCGGPSSSDNTPGGRCSDGSKPPCPPPKAPPPPPCPGDLVRLGEPKPYCGCRPGLTQQGIRCVPPPPPPTICPDGSRVPQGTACPRKPPPPPPPKICPDGSRVPQGAACPRKPPPPPPPKICPDGSRVPQGAACPRPRPPPPPPPKFCPPGLYGTPPYCSKFKPPS